MTSDVEEAAIREAAERKAEARAAKAEAKAKKKALHKAKKAKTSAERQKAIDAARDTGYSGRLILLNEDGTGFEPKAKSVGVIEKANAEAAEADAERRRLKAEAKAKKKATKKYVRSVKKMEKQKAMDAIRQTGWSRPVIMFNQQKLLNERSETYPRGLSYGEMVEIEHEWNVWAKVHGRDADSCLMFIEERCAEVYPSTEEQYEIYSYIAGLEETSENRKPKKKKTVAKAKPVKSRSVKKKATKPKAKPKARRR